MDLLEAIEKRHAVRAYSERPIDGAALKALREEIESINAESGLHVRLIENEEKAFSGFMAHYGKFRGVRNYIALVGQKGPALDEMCGYYGERLVLFAQTLGLNTCWVGMTFSKVPEALRLEKGEKLVIVISVGYGISQGVSHSVKDFSKVSGTAEEAAPDWYRAGIHAALLAPTAVNQQKFRFELQGYGKVLATNGLGFFAKVDLGIVKYHFEIGSGKDSSIWASA